MQYLSGILKSNKKIDAENMAERRDILAIVSGIIDRLPERQRIAVVNVYLRGLSTDIVAESLGLNRNAFYKLMHDARVTILSKLKSVHCLTLGDIYATFEE
jgi:DNA-directed RNA polymerase specialized sigma24 family protein